MRPRASTPRLGVAVVVALCTACGPAADAPPAPEAAPAAELRGFFRYMADAAVFTPCDSEERYPVAMEGGYLELERAYTAAEGNGEPLLVTLRGRIESRPPMEGPENVATLIVSEFGELLPDEGC